MKRLRTFEPFPALFLLLQLIWEGSLPASTNKSPAQGYWGIGWRQSTGTCGQCARPPALGGIQPWRRVEFNFLSNSLYTASQHLSNLCHLKKLSVSGREREQRNRMCFPIPLPEWHWKPISNYYRYYNGNTHFSSQEWRNFWQRQKNSKIVLINFCDGAESVNQMQSKGKFLSIVVSCYLLHKSSKICRNLKLFTTSLVFFFLVIL